MCQSISLQIQSVSFLFLTFGIFGGPQLYCISAHSNFPCPIYCQRHKALLGAGGWRGSPRVNNIQRLFVYSMFVWDLSLSLSQLLFVCHSRGQSSQLQATTKHNTWRSSSRCLNLGAELSSDKERKLGSLDVHPG